MPRSSRKKKPIFNPWAKRLHAPGESTLSPGEMTLGEQDIRRNDLLPLNRATDGKKRNSNAIVIVTQNVITFATECNSDAKCSKFRRKM